VAWETALHDGPDRGDGLAPRQVTLKPGAARRERASRAGAVGTALEISFRPDPTIWDGRFANNGWLQELPKPMTKLTGTTRP
jgi:molybdopterin-containing oxidoreductase family iron-sulfur binding subunit